MTDALIIGCVAIGTFFMFVASLGVLRLSDFYARIHAPTKAATVGLSALLLAFVIALPEAAAITKAALILVLIGATVPVGAHILMRAAYRARVPAARETKVDQYREELERRRARRAEPPASSDVHEEQ